MQAATYEFYLHRSHARDELRKLYKRVSDSELDAAAFLLVSGSEEAARAAYTFLTEAEKRIERAYPRALFKEERIDLLQPPDMGDIGEGFEGQEGRELP